MQRNAIEPILGALVLAAAAAFLFFAYETAGQRAVNGYKLTAQFSSVDGLQTGSDVRIGGVKIGQVTSIEIDPKTYLALVQFAISSDIQVPADSVAAVSTEGLLGGKYVGLEPGASDDMLKPGARITRTQASVSLENLIGQFIYGGASGGSKGDGAGQPAKPAHP